MEASEILNTDLKIELAPRDAGHRSTEAPVEMAGDFWFPKIQRFGAGGLPARWLFVDSFAIADLLSCDLILALSD